MLHWIGNNLGTILITLRSLPWWQPSSGAFTKAGAPGRAPAAAAAPTAPWRAPATAPTARRNDSDRRAAQRKRRLTYGSALPHPGPPEYTGAGPAGQGKPGRRTFPARRCSGRLRELPRLLGRSDAAAARGGRRMGFGLPQNPASQQRQFAWKASASREDGFVPYAGCCDTIRKPSETEAPRDFRFGKPSG